LQDRVQSTVADLVDPLRSYWHLENARAIKSAVAKRDRIDRKTHLAARQTQAPLLRVCLFELKGKKKKGKKKEKRKKNQTLSLSHFITRRFVLLAVESRSLAGPAI